MEKQMKDDIVLMNDASVIKERGVKSILANLQI